MASTLDLIELAALMPPKVSVHLLTRVAPKFWYEDASGNHVLLD